jgi:hypothetical protein
VPSNGNVNTIAGRLPYGWANGQGTSASFFYPSDVAIDAAGNVVVAD